MASRVNDEDARVPVEFDATELRHWELLFEDRIATAERQLAELQHEFGELRRLHRSVLRGVANALMVAADDSIT